MTKGEYILSVFISHAEDHFPLTVERVDPFSGDRNTYRLLDALFWNGTLYGGYHLYNSTCLIFYEKTKDGISLVWDRERKMDLYLAFCERYGWLSREGREG